MDELVIAGRAYQSRLLVGTGKYKDFDETRAAIEASGAEIVTIAIRRTNIGQSAGEPNMLDVLPPSRYTILPNTAGCYTAEDAVRTLRLARELLDGHDLVKLEVLGDPKTLYPNVVETLHAAKTLIADGFKVMVYTSDDPIIAKQFEEMGCVAVMPLASLIGSGMGLLKLHLPARHQPGAHLRVRGAEGRPLGLCLPVRRAGRQPGKLAGKIGGQHQPSDVVQQPADVGLVGMLIALPLGHQLRHAGAQQGMPPERLKIDRERARQLAEHLIHRGIERQAPRGVQPENHERLIEAAHARALLIGRRVRERQHARGEGGVLVQDLRHIADRNAFLAARFQEAQEGMRRRGKLRHIDLFKPLRRESAHLVS